MSNGQYEASTYILYIRMQQFNCFQIVSRAGVLLFQITNLLILLAPRLCSHKYVKWLANMIITIYMAYSVAFVIILVDYMALKVVYVASDSKEYLIVGLSSVLAKSWRLR